MARRKKRLAPPTPEEILEKFRDAETYWSSLHRQMDTDYRMFNGDMLVDAPDGFEVIDPGSAGTIVMTGADHVAVEPKVRVPEAGLSRDAQRRSEALEKGFQAALYRFDATEADSIERDLIVNGLWSGMLVSQGPLFDSEAWGKVPVASDYEDAEQYEADAAEYETTKKTAWPFRWDAPDPRYVYPDPGTVGKEYVIVSYERTAGSIKDQWPEWDMRLPGMSGGDKPLSSGTKVQWMEFWSKTHRAYLVGHIGSGQSKPFYGGVGPIDAIREHRYGKPPFQIRSAGFGTRSGPPENRFRPIFWAARSLLRAEIRAFSHREALIRKTAWTQMLAPLGSGYDSMEPGTVKELPPEAIPLVRPVSEVQPAAIQAVSEELTDLDFAIQKATVPSVVQGIRARGISSGYGQNSLVAQAKVRYGAIAKNVRSLIEEFLVDLGHCVEHVVEEPVPVWGQTRWGMVDAVLKPSDISGLRYVVVTINPTLPAERANEIEIGGVLLDRGVIDTDTYVQDFVGYENPGEIRERVLRDRALQAPEIVRVLTLAAALKGGYIDYLMEVAGQIGMDPGQLLATLGFGNPSQMAPAANQGAGAPQNVAAQRQGSQATLFGGAMKAQPVPGSPSAVRDQAVPGVPIGG
jgi:hypothetical protein